MKLREQTYYIFGALILLALLLWGFDTRPSTQKTLEKSRVLNTPGFDIHAMQTDAKKHLGPDDLEAIETLETQLRFATVDSVKLTILRQLSGSWFRLQEPLIAGYYADHIAEMQGDATGWSIAGTTFASVLADPERDEKQKAIARDQALKAFENAISLEPSAIEHRINQALTYVEHPDPAAPMKGIQMLVALAANHPQSALPPYHLARLAMKTGQVERAEERISQALAIDSANAKIACLAIDIYTAANKPSRAKSLAETCAGKR